MASIKKKLQRANATKLKAPSAIFEYIKFTHGFHRYPNDTRFTLVLRFCMVTVIAVFCSYILLIAFIKHQDQPVLTRKNILTLHLFTPFPDKLLIYVGEITFPAVAVCNENVISLKETAFIKDILTYHSKSELEINGFLDSLQDLTHYGPHSVYVPHHTEIMDILKHYNMNTDTIMFLLHQKCEDLILYCSFNGMRKDCNKLFRLLKTGNGYCCVFNNDRIYKDPIALSFYEEHDNDSHTKKHKDRHPDVEFFFTSEAGWNSGLKLLLNIDPSSYPSWSKARTYGAKIMLFDASDFPETNARISGISIGKTVGLDVEPIINDSHENLRKATVEQRQCWFTGEVKTLFQTTDYSFENCITECMMNYYIHICGCLPYKYPKFDETKYCELSDLKCLNNVSARIDPDCECLFECEDQHYNNGVSVLPFMPSLYPEDIIKNYNTSELAELQVFYAESTCNSYTKFLLADENNKIIVYGGILSLCFGFSYMSFLEISYLVAAYVFAIIVKIIAWIYDKIINKLHG